MAAHTPSSGFSRRAFLTWGARGGVVAAGVGYWLMQPDHDRKLVLATLGDAMREVERLSAAPVRPLDPATAWNWQQTLEHCAQSIEYSMTGFPLMKPVLFQRTVGAAAFAVFSWRGRMSHDLAEPIPGAPAIDRAADQARALARLQAAVAAFATWSGPLQPHFAYGPLDKAAYERAHALHIANHLTAFSA